MSKFAVALGVEQSRQLAGETGQIRGGAKDVREGTRGHVSNAGTRSP